MSTNEHALIRRLGRAVLLEFKRALCARGLRDVTFPVTQFGPYSFTCGNPTEYYRTVQFGGEACALGAFLFILSADDVVWDVGASVGLFSVHAAGVARSVVAFEPDPATCVRLEHNVRLNNLAKRISCRCEALGATAGTAVLRTDGLHGNAPTLADLGRHAGSASIKVTTADETVDAGMEPPNVLKIDVEGAELEVLRGADRLLGSADAPRVVFVEIHPEFLPQFCATAELVEAELRRHGYRFVSRHARADQVHVIASKP